MRLVRVGVLLAQSLVMAIWHHHGLLWTKPADLGPTFSREGPSSQLGVAQHDSTADRKQISMAWSGLAQKKGLVEKGFKSLGWNSNRVIGLSVLCCCFQHVLFYFQQNKINKGIFEFLDIGRYRMSGQVEQSLDPQRSRSPNSRNKKNVKANEPWPIND